MPMLEERKQLVLTKGDISVLKQLNAPPTSQAMAETTMALWLLILDSFGVEVTTKVKTIIQETLLQKGSNRAKA